MKYFSLILFFVFVASGISIAENQASLKDYLQNKNVADLMYLFDVSPEKVCNEIVEEICGAVQYDEEGNVICGWKTIVDNEGVERGYCLVNINSLLEQKLREAGCKEIKEENGKKICVVEAENNASTCTDEGFANYLSALANDDERKKTFCESVLGGIWEAGKCKLECVSGE